MKLNAEPLFTDRLLLRPYEEGDAEGMFSSYCHDEEVTRYLTWNPHPSLEDTKAFLAFKLQEQKEPYHYDWLITLGGAIIGSIDLVNRYEEAGFEVGYCLAPSAWGKGYMKEAFHAVLSFLFFEAGFAYAIMKADVRNTRSRRVIEREGFVYDHDEEEELPLKKKTAVVAVYHLEKKDFVR
jgi:ribosomal-protein-alanine N-acetyltransferase